MLVVIRIFSYLSNAKSISSDKISNKIQDKKLLTMDFCSSDMRKIDTIIYESVFYESDKLLKNKEIQSIIYLYAILRTNGFYFSQDWVPFMRRMPCEYATNSFQQYFILKIFYTHIESIYICLRFILSHYSLSKVCSYRIILLNLRRGLIKPTTDILEITRKCLTEFS